ncbi:MAG: DUF4399 domain-containing protein [Cyanobacteria bacterium P01_F01_bin.86]
MKRPVALLCLLLMAAISLFARPTSALANEYASKAPAGAAVYLIAPQNGETVTNTFTAKFGLSGMGIAPAGIDKEGTGHHHLLIDLETLPDLHESLAATDNIKHFCGGQTETTLTLPPGEHTLQLLLGNYVHIPHEPPVMSEPITITVE